MKWTHREPGALKGARRVREGAREKRPAARPEPRSRAYLTVHGWALGSSTDIDQLALTCGWHNRFKHAHPDRLTITKDEDGRYLYRLRQSETALGVATGRSPPWFLAA